MKLTEENIIDISVGDIFYMPESFKMPMKFIFVGVWEGRYRFISEYQVLSIYKENFDFNANVRINGLYSTYEECCVRMRELCLETIDHYNKHQLKNNPIQI